VLVDLPGGTASGDAIGHDTLQIHDLAQGIQIHGSPYDDEITTGPGPDAVFDNGGGTIDVGGGEDTVHQYGTDSSGPVTILGGTGADGIDATHDAQADLDGGPGADSFFLLSVAGSVTGSDGDDSVIADTRMGYQPSLSGGDGDDGLVLDFSWPSDMGTVTADLGAGEATSSVWGDLFPLTGFENLSVDLRGSSGRVGTYVLRGTDGDNDLTVVADGEGEKTPADLYGLGGDDRLLGGYGDDLLDGGPGHDLGQGNPGDDTCVSIEGPLSTHGTCEVIESRQ
jgi:Ca2+-binding RTX toxin-like protein